MLLNVYFFSIFLFRYTQQVLRRLRVKVKQSLNILISY